MRQMSRGLAACRARRSVASLVDYRSPEDPVTDAGTDPVVNRAALRRGCQGRPPDRPRAAFWNTEPAAAVPSQRLTRDHIILRELHADELRGDVQHDGGVGF